MPSVGGPWGEMKNHRRFFFTWFTTEAEPRRAIIHRSAWWNISWYISDCDVCNVLKYQYNILLEYCILHAAAKLVWCLVFHKTLIQHLICLFSFHFNWFLTFTNTAFVLDSDYQMGCFNHVKFFNAQKPFLSIIYSSVTIVYLRQITARSV